jgi:hypothetical protein
MNTFDAVMIAENGGNTEEETLQAWQVLVDTGLAWTLQGVFWIALL